MSQAEETPLGTEPLTVRERQQLQRLLSDPTQLPMAHKTWLVSYLETSDFNLPLSSIVGLAKRLDALEATFGAITARLDTLEADTP